MRTMLMALLVLPLLAQTPAPVDNEYTIKSTTNEVLLDLVVRDKHEKITTNLKPQDVQIYQDGVLQQVKGFRLVSGKEQLKQERTEAGQPSAAKSANGAGAPAQTVRNVNLVALVFRSGTAFGRTFAQKAALEFLESQILPNTYVAVFNLGVRLDVLQSFTRDKGALAKAIDIAAHGSPDQLASASSSILNQVASAATGGREGITVGSLADPAQIAGFATSDASQGFELADRISAGIVQQYLMDSNQVIGMRTLDAINALVRGLAKFPGRKTVLYMSEGMVMPQSGAEFVRAAISSANRANVSFYMVDTRGLTVGGANHQSAATNALRASAALSRIQNDPLQRIAASHQDDQLEYGMHTADDQAPMGELALSTGGTLIANTNDLRKPLGRIMEDIRTHYEVTFAPPPGSYDGHYRKIEVKLVRAGFTAQTRNGYYAVPVLHGEPILPSELANLAALDAKAQPRAFPLHAAVFQYHPGSAARQCEVDIEAPLSGLKFVPDGKGALTFHVTFVALLKDASGQVVDKVGQDIVYKVPAEKQEGFAAGNVIFNRPIEVPPGRYTIEASAVDQNANAASVKRVAFVTRSAPGLALSSVALVRRVSPLKDPRNPVNPLEFEGGRVDLSLTDPEKSAGGVSLYFVLYPQPAGPAPAVTMQFFRDGEEVARDKPKLTAADATGSVPLLAAANLKPGSYEVRVTAQQASRSVQQSIAFVLQ